MTQAGRNAGLGARVAFPYSAWFCVFYVDRLFRRQGDFEARDLGGPMPTGSENVCMRIPLSAGKLFLRFQEGNDSLRLNKCIAKLDKSGEVARRLGQPRSLELARTWSPYLAGFEQIDTVRGLQS